MAILFSYEAKKELKTFTPDNKENVSQTVNLLSTNNFREQNKIDLCLEEKGHKIWAFIFGPVWIGFHECINGDICVDQVSIRSRFRQ
jgi:hypothetical protein